MYKRQEYSYWNAKGDVNSGGVQQGTISCNNAAALAAQGIVACADTPSGASLASGQLAIQDDQRSDVVSGYYKFGGFRLGLAWNRSKTTNVASGYISGDRQAWAVPISYTMGPHLFGFVYVRANDSKDVTIGGINGTNTAGTNTFVSGSNTGASMYTLTYQYDLSKRTALGLTFSQLTNKANAAYGFFYNTANVFGSANTGVLAGEKQQLMAATIRHFF